MVDSMSAARNVLAEAQSKLEQGQGQLIAAADGPINDAKELVRMIFAAGYELPGLNEALGMLEEAQNDGHALASRLQAVRAKIEEVKGS